MQDANTAQGRHVLLLGATGTIGRATLAALCAAGHRVTCCLRRPAASDDALFQAPGVETVLADVTDAAQMQAQAQVFEDGQFDAVISCLASRSGAPADAWAVDHGANKIVLDMARAAGVAQFVLLSAICVQRPELEFQKAKLAFEAEVQASGLTWSIVRPTAFFKSLSGQLRRLRAGKPFLVFGDGRLTACKPISDRDLAGYIVGCLSDPDRQNRILPIGGPGPALTPIEQGEALFQALGQAPRFKHVPVRMMDMIVGGLSLAGRISARAHDKAELARIGRYYATQSMLVLDSVTGAYDADMTPEFGTDRLEDFYADLVAGRTSVDLGAHAVF